VVFAAEAGLATGSTGALVVDEHLRTSAPDVYAAGDCVEVTCALTGQSRFVPLGSLANRQGRVVGDNLGGLASRFGPVAGSACVKVFDTNVAATGLSEKAALRAGLEARAAWGTFLDVAHYFPEPKNIFMKVVYEAGSGRLLGLQAVSEGDVVKRIDVAAAVLLRGGTLHDLLDQEFCYSPPFNAALDPLHGLAATALNQERFGIPGLVPDAEVRGRAVLDVRKDDEITDARPRLPGAQNIACEVLRERLVEIPRERPLLIVCEKGPRSAEAARWLQGQGFQDVAFLAGGSAMRFAAISGE
jgi:rhodanese-related sulfurtransferase